MKKLQTDVHAQREKLTTSSIFNETIAKLGAKDMNLKSILSFDGVVSPKCTNCTQVPLSNEESTRALYFKDRMINNLQHIEIDYNEISIKKFIQLFVRRRNLCIREMWVKS